MHFCVSRWEGCPSWDLPNPLWLGGVLGESPWGPGVPEEDLQAQNMADL